MTDQEYIDFMDSPITDREKQTLNGTDWVFVGDDYIHIPDDWDGCMASGCRAVRQIILGMQFPQSRLKFGSNKKAFIEHLLAEKLIEIPQYKQID